MSHRRLFALLLLFGMMLIPVLAQETPSLFSTTFEDDTLPDALNIQYGTYEITDGQLAYTVDNGGFLVIPSGIDWTDYAIETDLTIIDGSVWIQARTGADLCSGYYLTLNPTETIIDLSVSDRDCNFRVLAEIDNAEIPTEMFTARIDVEGEQIRAYVADELVLEATDAQYPSGYPTINVFPTEETAQVTFDNLRVIALPEPVTEPEATAEATSEVTAEPEITPDRVDEATAEPEVTADPSAEVTDEPQALVDVELPPVNEIPLNDDPNRMVETLTELGLIPDSEGDLYASEGVVISRIGAWFEPLFEDVSARHVVMSGDIFFLPNSEGETCLLSARIERDSIGVAQRYLDIGVNSLDEVFIGETADNGEYSLATQDGMLTAAGGNILFVAYGDRLSVYVNGRVAFQNIEITRRDGSLGVSSNATTSYTVCHVTNLWAYTFDDSQS